MMPPFYRYTSGKAIALRFIFTLIPSGSCKLLTTCQALVPKIKCTEQTKWRKRTMLTTKMRMPWKSVCGHQSLLLPKRKRFECKILLGLLLRFLVATAAQERRIYCPCCGLYTIYTTGPGIPKEEGTNSCRGSREGSATCCHCYSRR